MPPTSGSFFLLLHFSFFLSLFSGSVSPAREGGRVKDGVCDYCEVDSEYGDRLST